MKDFTNGGRPLQIASINEPGNHRGRHRLGYGANNPSVIHGGAYRFILFQGARRKSLLRLACLQSYGHGRNLGVIQDLMEQVGYGFPIHVIGRLGSGLTPW